MEAVRYPNRKLYSKEVSRYLSAQEVFDAFLAEEKVQILDHASKKDVTSQVLLQALAMRPLSKDATQTLLSHCREALKKSSKN